MTVVQPKTLHEAARAAAAAGARVALRWQGLASELRIEEKAASDDLVSQADREAETAIRSVLADLRPDDAVLGEEGGSHDGTTGVRWLIDPIDGTTNFLYGRPDWAVSVAAVDGAGSVLVGVVAEPAVGRITEASRGGGAWGMGRRLTVPMRNDLGRALVELNLGRPDQRPQFAAVMESLVGRVRDVRRGGSAASALAQVATGRVDAAWVPGLQPWDCAAGMLIVAEAGGVVGDLDRPRPPCTWASGDVLAAPPALWEPLRQLLSAAFAPV